MSKELFVRDISFDAGEEDLRKLFSVIGRVTSVHLITDKQSGQFRGSAFIRMSSEAEAKAAINDLDGTLLLNRCISVQAARGKGVPPPLPTEPEAEKRPKHKKTSKRR